MTDTTLLPCPTCGTAPGQNGPWLNPDSWYVACQECGLSTRDFDTDAEAIAAWNRRPSPSVHRQASAETTDLCPGCHGSGEQQFMTQHLGPNDYEVAGPCSKCGGSGVVDDGTTEAAEILQSLIANIERHGMYSKESTLGFLSQAYHCLKPANPQSRQASAGQEGVTDENIRSLWQTTDTGDVETDIMSFARSLLALPNHWRSALEFYADQSNWTSCSAMERGPRVDEDGGDMARAALSTAAPESGWIDVKERMPSCDGETMFIGENEAGYIACFNELTPDGYCMHATAEGSICVMSGLRHWSRVNRPAAPTAGETL